MEKAAAKTQEKAIAAARWYLTNRGYAVEKVSKDAEPNGYELIGTRGGEKLAVKVWGSSRLWDVPRLAATDFALDGRLVADFLYVPYVTGGEEPKLCIIPREAIKPEFILGNPARGYHLWACFTNPTTLKPFLRTI